MSNKIAIFLSACVGIFTGIMIQRIIPESSLTERWRSNTPHIYIQRSGFGFMEELAVLDLKKDGEFDMELLVNHDVGFVAVGRYSIVKSRLSLHTENHEVIKPERGLTTAERLLTHSVRLDNDDIILALTENGRLIVLGEYSARVYSIAKDR